MQFFLGRAVRDDEIERDHGGSSAQFSGDGGEVVTGDGADGAADIDDLCGSQAGGKSGDNPAAGHGEGHLPEAQEGMAAEVHPVGLDSGDGAGGIDGGVALNENHASHVTGDQVRVFRARSGGAALGGDETVVLDLRGKLLQSRGLKTGENQRRGDGFESRAEGEARVRDRFIGQRELLGGDGRRVVLRGRTENVLDGRDPCDGFLGEYAEFEGERAGKFAFDIDGAAAHAGDDAGVLDFGAFELDEDDGLARAEEIGHYADDFEVELFDLIAGEDGVGVTLHARLDLADRDDFGELRR